MDSSVRKLFIRRAHRNAVTWLLFGLLITPAAALAQSPFSIDGVVPDASCCAEFSDPYGSVSELGPVNASTTKLGSIHSAPPPMLDFTNPNSSTDIASIWLGTRTDATGDIWLYFAWERDATTGSSVISYEFQSAAADAACVYTGIDQVQPESAEETALIASCNPWANRQAGDFLVVWDFGGGSTDIILREFDGIEFDAGINLSSYGSAYAALNADSSRGEGAINLTEVVFGPVQQCLMFANVIPGTITGNSDTADYKDTVLADVSGVLNISNCGTLNITKSTEPGGEVGNFSYNVDRIGGGDIDFTPRTSASGWLIDDGGSDSLLVLPGTDYRLTEDLTGEPNFELKSIYCNRPAPNTDGTNGFAVDLSTPTDCVITNELRLGTITVIKEVVSSYGGTAQASDFCIALNDDENTPVFPGDDLGTQFTFLEGNQFDVAEVACGDPDTSPPGYTASYSGECSGVIEARTDKVCTITNTQTAQPTAEFTLFKTLITDNGGTASQSDWTLNASLKAGSSGRCTVSNLSGNDGGSGVTGSLSVTDEIGQCTYVLSESGGPAEGYTAGNWSCAGDVNLNGDEITVGPGGGSCSITNDDNAPSLTLIKQVTNDNGGTAQPGDWTLTAAGYDAASPDAGTYALSESGPAGYTQTSLTCSNSGDAQVSSVTLGLGEDVTCTFVNDDNAPSLTLIKQVTNDNGGTAQPGDWTLTAAGYDAASPDAGTYALSESGPAGYTQTSLTCSNSGDAQVSSVTLGLGEDVTCTFVNDDNAPSLTLVKQVTNDNGGTAQPGDWTLTAAGYDAASPDAGTYALSESGPAGYTQTSLTCSNSGDAQVSSVTLGLGEDVTCTFVNDDNAPSLTLIKQVTNDNGGTAQPGDWTLTAAGYDAASPDAGTYALSESGPAGYTQTSLTCSNSGDARSPRSRSDSAKTSPARSSTTTMHPA